VISARGISRHFSRGAETVTALDDVSLDLHVGELTVAAGPSGSGKTTLLSILAGYETADSGRIETQPPLPAAEPAAQRWRDVAFVPQSLGLLDELTIAENVDLPARLDPRPAGAPVEDLLELLEIGHLADRFPAQVSNSSARRSRGRCGCAHPCSSPTSRPATRTGPASISCWTSCASTRTPGTSCC
jgi:putative ABC transport system ATP-binding protein